MGRSSRSPTWLLRWPPTRTAAWRWRSTRTCRFSRRRQSGTLYAEASEVSRTRRISTCSVRVTDDAGAAGRLVPWNGLYQGPGVSTTMKGVLPCRIQQEGSSGARAAAAWATGRGDVDARRCSPANAAVAGVLPAIGASPRQKSPASSRSASAACSRSSTATSTRAGGDELGVTGAINDEAERAGGRASRSDLAAMAASAEFPWKSCRVGHRLGDAEQAAPRPRAISTCW